jgi:hypothetical protein
MYQISLQYNGIRVQRLEDSILSLQEGSTEMNKHFGRLPMDQGNTKQDGVRLATIAAQVVGISAFNHLKTNQRR